LLTSEGDFVSLTTDRSEFPIPKVLMTVMPTMTTLLRLDKFLAMGKQGIPRVLTTVMAELPTDVTAVI
jgi:hypothetical protein